MYLSMLKIRCLGIFITCLAFCIACSPEVSEVAPTATVTSTGVPAATQPAATVVASTAVPTSAAAPAQTGTPVATVTVEAALLEGQALVEALRAGGHVIYFRHAATDFSQPDADRQNLDNCDTQRNLSEQGRNDSRAIGAAFQSLGIPVGQVLASPYCRTRDTAQEAFGRVEVTQDLLSTASAPDDTERQRIVESLLTLLATPPAQGSNTVLIGHMFNLQAAVKLSIAEGEAAIFAPAGPNGATLVARVRPEQWTELAAAGSPTTSEPVVERYPVPAGSGPHDVAPAADGKVWYTGQRTGELGRLDPATGEVERVALGAGSAPHGVIVGPDGAAWVTDSGLNGIVRVDAATLEVTTFPLPANRRGANLNTATFDLQGVLWFTGQAGIYGRLDPASGEMQVYDAPRGRGPYGITTTPQGDVYYASLAGNHIARIDTATGEAEVIEPPTTGQGARRVWSDSGGRIWVSEYAAGQVAVYNPADRSWREWKLPGDRPLAYAVYVDERDQVWLSDFGADALVRFDPVSEQFLQLPLPGEPGNARQILGRPGEVWTAESAADTLVVVRTNVK